MAVEVVRGGLQHLDEIVGLNKRIFAGMYTRPLYNIEEYKKRLSAAAPHFYIYIAKDKNTLVGDSIAYHRQNSLYLWITGVVKEYRRLGVASIFFDMNEDHARNEGLETVTLKVFNVSREMQSLALMRGYEIFKIEESPSKNPQFNAVHLRLALR